MNDIKFEPTIGNYMIIKFHIKNYIPPKFHNIIYNDGRQDHFGAGLLKIEEDWYFYIDKLKTLPVYELEEIRNIFNENYEKLGGETYLDVQMKTLIRKLTKETNTFLNSLINVDGVVVTSIALIGDEDTLIAIKYPDSSANEVTKLFLDFVNSSQINIDLLDSGKEDGTPLFFRFYNSIKTDYSLLLFIETVWKLKEEEMKNENGGIFQNRMVLKPKFFGPKYSPLISKFSANVLDKNVKGNAEFKVLSNYDGGSIAEFNLESKWFNDFYNNVVKPINGSFYYWAYSDGESQLHNYYIIPVRNGVNFIKGLKKHWNEPQRARHHNAIVRVQNLQEIVEKFNFKK